MFPKILFTSLSILVSSYAFGIQADGPKVFIEVQSSFQTGTPTITMPEATSRFQAVCVDCQLTIRKDVAEYLVVVAKNSDSSGEQWLWTVYENVEGMLLQQGQTGLLDDSFGDAAKSIMRNWGPKEFPGPDEEFSTSLPPEMNEPGIVYFYRKEGMWSRSQNPVIYWGGQELAKLTKNKFFAVSLEPGIHGFSVNKELPPEQRVRLQVEPGRTYFLKFSSANVFAGRGGPTFTLMNTKTAQEEFKKLKPEETKNIRAPTRVLADVRPDFESAGLEEEFSRKRRAAALTDAQTGWRYSEYEDKLNRTTRYSLVLESNDSINTGFEIAKPVIHINCTNGKWNIWLDSKITVDWDYNSAYEGILTEIGMRYTDESRIKRHTFTPLRGDEGFYFYNGSSIYDGPEGGIGKLRGHPGAVIQFTAYDGNLHTVEFDLRGTNQVLANVAQLCQKP